MSDHFRETEKKSDIYIIYRSIATYIFSIDLLLHIYDRDFKPRRGLDVEERKGRESDSSTRESADKMCA